MDDIDTCTKKMSIVITDVRMPVHNGFDIAMRARAVNPHVPIVFVTAFEINRSEFKKVFPSIQGINFLQKPFRLNTMLEMVKNLTSEARYRAFGDRS
jgi:FixJ family two-component response regulator